MTPARKKKVPGTVAELKKALSECRVFEVDDNGYGGNPGMGDPAAICIERGNDFRIQKWYDMGKRGYVKKPAIAAAYTAACVFG